MTAFFADHHDEPGTTLIATHGSLARLIVSSHLLAAPPPQHRRLWLDNCHLAVVERRDGIPKLVGFNVLTSQLSAQASSPRSRRSWSGRGGSASPTTRPSAIARKSVPGSSWYDGSSP